MPCESEERSSGEAPRAWLVVLSSCPMARRVTVAVVAALVLALPAPGNAAPREPRLRAVESWALAIGEGALDGDVAQRLGRFDLVVVDGEEVTSAQVRALRARGAIVLGYLTIGTIEPWRSWYPLARPYRLERWRNWDEWYADTARAGFRRLIVRQVAPALLRKGLDGLFLDNVDMIETHRPQGPGMRSLVRALSALVHGRAGLLFAQNGDAVIGPFLPHLDGWNREDVSWTWSFSRRRYVRVPAAGRRAAQAALRRVARAGLLVTATDYVGEDDAAASRESVANACAAGALPFVSDIGLRRLPRRPLRCPG